MQKWCEEVAGGQGAGCRFGDIMDLLSPKIDDTATYSQKLEAGKKAALAGRAYCQTHRRWCATAKSASFDVSGLPCPDMSTAGKRKRRAGVTSGVYVAHGEYVTRNAIPLLLIECTKDMG